MILIYRIIINVLLLISPIIIIFRLFKKKEDISRFKEKFCFFSKKRKKGKLLWFHGASVGEIKSILPIIEKLSQNKNIDQILITSNTISSAKIISEIKINKIVHQYFPIDINFFSKKFINYWQPNTVFFIDSEIWPNMITNIKKNKIPLILLNARITKKSFVNWSKIKSFAKTIFNKFDLCLVSNVESKKYLTLLGAKKIKYIGNIKYAHFENEKIFINKNLEKFLLNKKVWCASSTHDTEELFCAAIHKELKKKYKKLVTIIIPRHINRIDKIKNDLEKLNLVIYVEGQNKRIPNNTDIYLVNSYGKTKSFFKICKNVFLGGSIIKHGGQNPLEAAILGCNIIHGPNISNFNEIYNFLYDNKISHQIKNFNDMISKLDMLFFKAKKQIKSNNTINIIGKRILKLTLKEIYSYI